MAVLKSTTNSKARGRNIVDEPKPAIVPIISAIRAEMKNSIVSSSIFYNSMESLYKYHYKIQYYNLLNPKSTCRTTIVVLTGQEQTSFILTTDKTRVFAEVVGSTPATRSTFINLVGYGIILGSFSVTVGQNSRASLI